MHNSEDIVTGNKLSSGSKIARSARRAVKRLSMAPSDVNPPKKLRMEDVKADLEKTFTPRAYQVEILEAARKGNTIACLGTGTGKTFIAVMLIRDCGATDVRVPFDRGGKRIFFLVPTVPLVHQQAKTISDHTDLKVKKFSGDMNVDSWNKDKWTSEFQENEVLVMTAEIFRIIVDHAFIPLNQIKLIIFDECHRAQGDSPYSQAMKCFTSLKADEIPRIFGLSASLINSKCKPTQLERQLKDLEKTLRCSITTASDIIDLQKYGADPDEYLVCYRPYIIETDLIAQIANLRQDVSFQKTSLGRGNDMIDDADIEFFDRPLRCLNSIDVILRTLGPWCAMKAAEVFIKEITCILRKHALMKDQIKEVLIKLNSFLEYFIGECRKFDFEFRVDNMQIWPSKLQRLLEIFMAITKSRKFLKESVPTVSAKFEEDPELFYQMLKTKGCNDLSSVQICSIVFVEQRVTAYVLHEWVQEIKKHFSQLDFLTPRYIVGHGNAGVKQTCMSEKTQKAVLKDFRQKKCNVLISTCVLEEGMDVQQCNVVIRFDLPNDFRGYVQSKGRARAKGSIYIMMSEVGERHARFCLDMCNFKTIEKMLLDKCHNRSEPSEEEINEFMDSDLIPPYMPYGERGPRITLISAISLINRYCANLPSDMATKLSAKWIIQEIDPDSPVKQYECTLKMPINSPLRKPIVGRTMPQKRLAKMAAALEACQKLDELGELNEHLVPISSLLEEKIEEEIGPFEEEDGKGAIPGTKRRRQIYRRHVPSFLQNSRPQPQSQSFLHVLKMELREPLPKALNPRNRPIKDPAASPRNLGILLSKQLPEVNSFPLFTKIGKVVATVTLCKSVSVSSEQLKAIEEFHEFIFSDALFMDKNKTFSPDSSEMPFYIVPIITDSKSSWLIDWRFMSDVRCHPYNNLKNKTFETVGRFDHSESAFEDAVILKSYQMNMWKTEVPTCNHVIRVSDKTPNSEEDFKECGKTFKEYYKKKYNIKIQNDHQHLVETFTNAATVNWKPIYKNVKEVFEYQDPDTLSKTKQKRLGYHEFLVPELSIIHPFPSSFLLKLQFLPTILFRLRSLLVAEDLRQAVARCNLVGTTNLPNGFHWPYFNLETSDKELRQRLCELGQLSPTPVTPSFVPQDIKKNFSTNEIVSFTRELDLRDHPGPNPSLLLQALTSKGAGDEFDLERLEMIGDSFLKYVISVKTYVKYPRFDEGKLTKMRSRIIQNLHLYQLAKKRKLPEYLMCSSFSCKTTWLPPCYTVDEGVEGIIENNSASDEDRSATKYFFTRQSVSDKCIADAVEALIGAYLLSCGQRGALMFMSWLGLNPLHDKKDTEVKQEDFMRWPPQPPNAIVNEIPNVHSYVNRHTCDFDRFEAKIKYKFKDRALLLQAFSHPSYIDNEVTDCYQRLEFLGDAVLDFLITRQLYEDPNDHSPGKLTDLRSALVNNIYFAYLAVKYEYHKHLKIPTSQLFGLINHFISIFVESESFKFFQEYGYNLEEIECFELDEVEVPKALGDLFESVAGAIYLDSGMSLDTVWKVYYPMMAPAMRHLTKHVPLSPVRELYEILQRKNIFSPPVQRGEKTYILVTLPNGKTIEGVGPNKKVAKRSAAKRALHELKKRDEGASSS